MSEYISRFDSKGKSIITDIYYGVQRGDIRIKDVEESDGRRLDHFAQFHYGNSMLYWIIAAASGIRWPLGIGPGNANRKESEKDSISIIIPVLEDIMKLKNR